MARYPTRFQLRTLWNAATGVSILVLGALIVGLIWLIGKIFGFLQPVLVPLAVAAITAYLLDPIVRLFQKRGFSRRWSVVSVFASFTLAVAGLIAIMIPLVGGQIHEFQTQREAMAASAKAQIQEQNPPPKSKASQGTSGEPANPGDTSSRNQPNPEVKKEETESSFDQVIVDILIHTRNKSTWAKPFIDPLLASPIEELEALGSSPGERSGRAAAGTGSGHGTGNSQQPRKDDVTARLDRGDYKPALGDTQLWVHARSYFDEVFGWIKGGAGKVLGFLGLALGFVMVPIYLYYILNESAAIKEHWHDYVPLKASRFKTELVETLTEINRYLISFFRGQVLVAFIDGILVGIALTIFGLPLGLLIGILMALLGIIPYIGNILTLIPACVLGMWFHFSVPANQGWLGSNPWTYVGATVAIFVVVQQINSLVTAPKIVGDSVGLHPMTVIFSMLFWSLILGGFVGALLAVPLTAAVKVLFRRYIWERKIKEDEEEKDGYEEWEPSEGET